MSDQISITLNGEPRQTYATTIAALVRELELEPQRVAVERNREIVPRSTLEDAPLAEGNWPLLSASAIRWSDRNQMPKEMDRADMDRVTAQFVAATEMADRLLERGIYVIGFSFPVVPKGRARIRTQMSAGLTRQHLDEAVEAFTAVGRELGVIN
mgnify:CR=1 FL=1